MGVSRKTEVGASLAGERVSARWLCTGREGCRPRTPPPRPGVKFPEPRFRSRAMASTVARPTRSCTGHAKPTVRRGMRPPGSAATPGARGPAPPVAPNRRPARPRPWDHRGPAVREHARSQKISQDPGHPLRGPRLAFARHAPRRSPERAGPLRATRARGRRCCASSLVPCPADGGIRSSVRVSDKSCTAARGRPARCAWHCRCRGPPHPSRPTLENEHRRPRETRAVNPRAGARGRRQRSGAASSHRPARR
jgi:hypothetical protein